MTEARKREESKRRHRGTYRVSGTSLGVGGVKNFTEGRKEQNIY